MTTNGLMYKILKLSVVQAEPEDARDGVPRQQGPLRGLELRWKAAGIRYPEPVLPVHIRRRQLAEDLRSLGWGWMRGNKTKRASGEKMKISAQTGVIKS